MNLKAPIHPLLRTFGFVIMLTLSPVGGFAAPADLDLSFGAGTATTNFGPGNDRGESVAVQPDGKILAVGTASGGGSLLALARYNLNGTLDKTFNGTGKVRMGFDTGYGSGRGVAVQPDGKILAVGNAAGGVGVVRFNANGSLDTTFNGTGFVTTDFGYPENETATSVTVQTDGKILVAGYAFLGLRDNGFVVARYNANGSLDTTFNGTGKIITNFGGGDDRGQSLTVQSNGKILVAGFVQVSNLDYDFALVRYNSNGKLDLTFNGTGMVRTSFGSATDTGHSVKVQPNGKILVAGTAANFSTLTFDIALVRYNSDGSLDLSFNGTGMATVDFGSSSDLGNSLALQADGKIVVAGSSNSSFALVRFNSNGSLDATLNGSGKLTTPVGSGTCSGHSVVLAGGKIIVAGTASNGSNDDFALASYNSDGTLDKTFHALGRVRTGVGPFGSVGNSVAVAADGKIVVAGTSSNGSYLNTDFAVVRYNADGTRDTTFNLTGKVTTELGPNGDYGESVAVLANGKILVAGIASGTGNNNSDFGLVRYNADGSLDTTFQGTGKVTTDFDAGNDDGRSLALQTDGKILVAGTARSGNRSFFALVRYNINGTLDATFNGTGKVTTAIGSNDSEGLDVAVRADGKILVAGSAGNIPDYLDIALARYNTDGSLDTTFHGDGKVRTAFGSGWDFATSVKVQSDGKIVVAGSSWNGSNDDVALVRYKTNGSLDTTFNGTGKITTAIGSGHDAGRSMALQTNGKIVVVGYSQTEDGADIAVLRYNSNGSLDDTFHGTGIRTTAFRTRASGRSVTLQPDGKIVVAGWSDSSNGDHSDFAVVRYMGGM